MFQLFCPTTGNISWWHQLVISHIFVNYKQHSIILSWYSSLSALKIVQNGVKLQIKESVRNSIYYYYFLFSPLLQTAYPSTCMLCCENKCIFIGKYRFAYSSIHNVVLVSYIQVIKYSTVYCQMVQTHSCAFILVNSRRSKSTECGWIAWRSAAAAGLNELKRIDQHWNICFCVCCGMIYVINVIWMCIYCSANT